MPHNTSQQADQALMVTFQTQSSLILRLLAVTFPNVYRQQYLDIRNQFPIHRFGSIRMVLFSFFKTWSIHLCWG